MAASFHILRHYWLGWVTGDMICNVYWQRKQSPRRLREWYSSTEALCVN